jgi:hypothetical protein
MNYILRTKGCKFCAATGRNGCLSCEAESDAEYKRQFPDGPKPMASFENTEEGMAGMKALLSRLFGGVEEEAKERIDAIPVNVIDQAAKFNDLTVELVRRQLASVVTNDIIKERVADYQAEFPL